MKKIHILLFLLPVLAWGGSLEDIISASLRNDKQLAILIKTLENSGIKIEKDKQAQGWSLSATTGQQSLLFSRSLDVGQSTLSGSPQLSLNLGEELGTSLNLAAPFQWNIPETASSQLNLPSADATQSGYSKTRSFISPSLGVSQSLDVFKNKKMDSQDLADQLTLATTRVEIFKRTNAVQQNVLNMLRELLAAGQQEAQTREDLTQAQNSLKDAKELSTYNPDSVSFKTLEYNVSRLQRELNAAVLQRTSLLQELGQTAGMEIDNPPPPPELVIPALPETIQQESQPDIYLARLDRELQAKRLEEETGPFEPSFSLNGGYSFKVADSSVSDHDVNGGISAVFEDISATLTAGDIIDQNIPYVSASFTWNMPNKKTKALTAQEYKNNLAIAQLKLENATQEAQNSFKDLQLKRVELTNRKTSWEENQKLAELRLKETREGNAQGLISQQELDQARWELKNLNYDREILNLDILLFINSIRSLQLN